MKLVFLGTSFAIVYHMRYNRQIKVTYDREQDTFRHYFLVLPCFGLAALIHQKATLLEARVAPGAALLMAACDLFRSAGSVDLLHLLGGSCHSSPAGTVAAHAKY